MRLSIFWLLVLPLSSLGNDIVVVNETDTIPVGIFCETQTGSGELDNGQLRFFHSRWNKPLGWAVIGMAPAQCNTTWDTQYDCTTLIGTFCVRWGMPRVWKWGFHEFRVLHFKQPSTQAIADNLSIDPRLQDGRHTVHPWAFQGTLLHDYGVTRYLIKNPKGSPPGKPVLIR